MIYALVILSCLSSGNDCKKETVAENLSVFGCMMGSQMMAAQWQKLHPDRKIKKLWCKVPVV